MISKILRSCSMIDSKAFKFFFLIGIYYPVRRILITAKILSKKLTIHTLGPIPDGDNNCVKVSSPLSAPQTVLALKIATSEMSLISKASKKRFFVSIHSGKNPYVCKLISS